MKTLHDDLDQSAAGMPSLDMPLDMPQDKNTDKNTDFAALIDSVASGIAVYDGHELLYCSAVYLKLFGFKDMATFRRAIHDGQFVLPERKSDPEDSDREEHFEFRGIRVDGEELWLDFHRRPFVWSGRPATLVTVHEITRPKKTEQALRGDNQMLGRLLDASPALIGLINRHSVFEFVNRPFAELLGIDVSHVRNVSATQAVPGASYKISRDALALAMAGQQVTLLSEVKSKSGRTLVFENHYRPRYTEYGQDGAYLVAFDVSERVEATSEFRASEDRFRKLIALVPLGIARVDRVGCVRLSNIAYDTMFGYEPGELLSTRIWDLYVPEEQLKQRDYFFRALHRPPSFASARCQRKDGRIIDVLLNWSHEYDEAGNVCGMIVVVSDATADLTARRELQAAKDSAERATLEKSRFLAAASHDLQQPLHSLSILLGLLSGQGDGPRRQEILGLMERAIDGARTLVRAVIDISKLEAGVVVPRVESFPLRDIFDQIEAELAPLTAGRPVAFRMVRSTAWVKSDRLLLKGILQNLVSNAIRYTSSGKILIGARQQGKMLRLFVYDTGKGIPPERRQDIFTEFTRIERGEGEDESPGLGLGLSIVERCCTLLGHNLVVRSELGHGSVFMLDVPFLCHSTSAALESKAEAKTTYQAPHGLVLLIEDNAMTALACRDLVESWGNRCLVALNEADALQVISVDGQQPDVILADYNLANHENGIRVIDRLLAIMGRPVPAILMTANDSPECEEAARLRGIPIIQKPANPARLRALLSYCLATRQ